MRWAYIKAGKYDILQRYFTSIFIDDWCIKDFDTGDDNEVDWKTSENFVRHNIHDPVLKTV